MGFNVVQEFFSYISWPFNLAIFPGFLTSTPHMKVTDNFPT